MPLPLVNHKSNTVDLLLHLMITTVEYKEYLNGGQVAVDVSHQLWPVIEHHPVETSK